MVLCNLRLWVGYKTIDAHSFRPRAGQDVIKEPKEKHALEYPDFKKLQTGFIGQVSWEVFANSEYSS